MNGELSRVEQIKDFRILPKALDPEEDDEPVTPTRKVKRHLMYEHFKSLIEQMYDDREERLIAAESGNRRDRHDKFANEQGRTIMLKRALMGALACVGARRSGPCAGCLRHRRERGAHRTFGRHQRAADRGASPLCRPAQQCRRRQRQEDPARRPRRFGRAVEGRRQRQAVADAGQRSAAGAVEPVLDLRTGDRRDQARQGAADADGRGVPEGGLSAGRPAAVLHHRLRGRL